MKKILKNKWLWIIICIIAVFFIYTKYIKKEKESFSYLTSKIERGNVKKEITANGTINPVNLIKVGTQVSGLIEKVYVDFNDDVKAGQILAELDKSVLKSQLDMAKAKLDKSRASLNLAKLDLSRAKELFAKDYIARAELDTADVSYKSAVADYNSAESEYKRAEINLGYATIKSPVSGVVISREIDEGQTVASSFSSPDLFKIAVDLSKMQVEASVSEADIGMIKSGQMVSFTVDAYPKETFNGSVDNIRLNPVNESNVVTYTVIIKINNEDMKLIPGMTAYINIVIQHAENVLKINNSAFNFVPKTDGNVKQEKKSKKDKNTIYLLKDKKLEMVEVVKGVVGESETEIISDKVKEGDEVIEDYIDLNKKSSTTMGMGGPMNGGGGRR